MTYAITTRAVATISALSCVLLGHPAAVSAAEQPEDAADEETLEEEDAPAEGDNVELEEDAGDGEAGDDPAGDDPTAAGESEDTADAGPAPAPAPASKKERPAKKDRPQYDKKALILTVTGYGLLGVGAGLLGGMAAGLGQGKAASEDAKAADVPSAEQDRVDAIDRGRKADNLALGLGLAAGAVLLTGAILVGVGHPRLKKSRKTARNVCLPAASRTGAGLGCAFSF